MKGKIYGQGINDLSRPTRDGNNVVKHWHMWSNMLFRCYSEDRSKVARTYDDCYVSDNFKQYSYFYDWCEENKFFKYNGYHLDKDFLGFSRRIYSEDTCVFIPKRLNGFLINIKVKEDFPFIGVDKDRKTFRSRLRDNKGGRIYLGNFKNPEDAELVYLEKKSELAKELSKEFDGLVDERVIKILRNFDARDYLTIVKNS